MSQRERERERERERDRLVFQMIMASVSSASFMSSPTARRPARRPLFGCLVALLPLPSLPCSSSSVGDPISYLICIMHCCVPLSCRRSERASKRPYYYREAASKRHSQATPKGGRTAPCSALPPSWIKDGGEREENSASMQAHMA